MPTEKGRTTKPHDDKRAWVPEVKSKAVGPPRDELDEIGARLEAAVRGAGVSLEGLLEAARAARAQIAKEEFGVGAGK